MTICIITMPLTNTQKYYICKLCNYKTPYKNLIIAHKNRQNPCNITNDDETVDNNIYSVFVEKPNISKTVPQIINDLLKLMKTLTPLDNADLINKYFTTLTDDEQTEYLSNMDILDNL